MTKKILVWGFYNQGNLGDDLMGAIFHEILEELGATPIIYTTNRRFNLMGYRTIDTLEGLEVDGVILGGGAFLKRGGDPDSPIETSIADLGAFIAQKAIPVFAASIGSDGIDKISQASPARRTVLESTYFKGAAVRLESDLKIGIPALRYIPDIILSTKEACERFARLSVPPPSPDAPKVLINLSRRSAWQIPRALWIARGRKTAFFRAHTGTKKSGGEIALPGLRSIDEDDICKAIGYIAAADIMISSKLHPGIIAVSFGRDFFALSPRPKTTTFLKESHRFARASEAASGILMYKNAIREFIL